MTDKQQHNCIWKDVAIALIGVIVSAIITLLTIIAMKTK